MELRKRILRELRAAFSLAELSVLLEYRDFVTRVENWSGDRAGLRRLLILGTRLLSSGWTHPPKFRRREASW